MHEGLHSWKKFKNLQNESNVEICQGETTLFPLWKLLEDIIKGKQCACLTFCKSKGKSIVWEQYLIKSIYILNKWKPCDGFCITLYNKSLKQQSILTDLLIILIIINFLLIIFRMRWIGKENCLALSNNNQIITEYKSDTNKQRLLFTISRGKSLDFFFLMLSLIELHEGESAILQIN